jgi:hypothetical protein
MGWRFYRRVRILPGVTLNVSKRGASVSVGPRGAHVTLGKRGVRESVGIPGTGISYTSSGRRPWPITAILFAAAAIALAVIHNWPLIAHWAR